MSYSIINKGKLNSPVINNFISLTEYLFVKENGRKFLLLKLFNGRNENVTGVTLEISQKDALGTSLGTQTVDCPVINGMPDSPFVLDRKIALKDKCVDFYVKIISADFGNYIYAADGNELVLSYKKQERNNVMAEPFQITGAENRSVSVRKFKIPAAACILMLAVLVFSCFFTYFHLQNYITNSDTFFYLNVEYEFENGDKSDDSRIYAVGSKSSAKNIIIPEKIKGHEVMGISRFAFSGNPVITQLTVKGPIEIEEGAFSGCKNLSAVTLEKVTQIGRYAFGGCGKLTEFNASNLSAIGKSAFEDCVGLKTFRISNDRSVLKIGENAFTFCAQLETVVIDQFIDYSDNQVFFKNCFNLRNLRLKNYNYSYEFNNEYFIDSTDKTISGLFGYDYTSTITSALDELIIDYSSRIPDNFCYGMPLASITINNLEFSEIGNNAFYNCTNLKKLDVPKAVTRVGNNAFFKTAITGFDGGSVNYIGDDAFSGCAELSAFDLNNNDSLNYIGEGAFSGCLSLESFFIPPAINAIKARTFESCVKLSEVVTGSELRQIGEYAFRNCSGLKTAPLSEAVSIGAGAFSNCDLLEALNFSQNLTSIGSYAFSGCTLLKSVTVPQSVIEIGLGAFLNCTALKEMTLPFIGGSLSNNKYLSYIFGTVTVFSSNDVPKALEKITINFAEEIGERAFYGCAYLKEIVIDSRFTRIGNSAFGFCRSLNNFVIPSSVTQIGSDAFSNCYKLYEIYNLSPLNIVRESLAFGGAGYYALKVYKSIDEEQIAKFSYEDYEFGRNDEGKWYLINYSGAKNYLLLPQNLYYGGVNIGSYEVIKYMMTDNDKIKDIYITDGVTAIGEYSFSNFSAVTLVSISDSVKLIGLGAFSGCVSLKEVTLPFIGGSSGNNRYLGYIFGSEQYDNPDLVPSNLRTVTITNADDVPDYAFYGCGGLTSVSLPSNYISIGNYAFYGCGGLSAVNISANCIAIGDYAFFNCRLLKSPALPDNLFLIGEYAFSGCETISRIAVPDSVNSIGRGAFSGCASIKEITLPFIGGSSANNRYLAYIFGADSCYDNDMIPLSLRTVVLTKGTDIPEYAFYYCTGLTSVILPFTVETIGRYAFYSCADITSIAFPDSLRIIGESAFRYCRQLKKIDLPVSVKTIDAYAFSECNSLEKVILSSDINIRESAFAGCEILYEIYNLGNMNIKAGGKDNGLIAYNAIAVYTSLQDTPMKEATVNDIVFKYYGDNWAAVNYTGSASEIRLSFFEYQGKTVLSYGVKSSAFRSNGSLVTLIIGKEVAFIEENAFNYCYNLTTVKFENSSITEIKDNVFSSCVSLTKIDLPERLTRIGNFAFYDCRKLYLIRIPENVTEIGNYAFDNCFALCDVYNFSKTLSVKKGSRDNGYIAYYAIRVSTSDIAPLDTIVSGGFRFMRFEEQWYMISNVSNVSSLSLPKSFTYNGTTFSSYILRESALSWQWYDEIFIPRSVSEIQRNQEISYYLNFDIIYYEGTRQEWTALMNGIPDSELTDKTVYYNSAGTF